LLGADGGDATVDGSAPPHLLECLGKDELRRLCALRSLPVALFGWLDKKEDLLVRLAPSYRDNREELIAELARAELITVLRVWGHPVANLHGPSLPELREIANRLFLRDENEAEGVCDDFIAWLGAEWSRPVGVSQVARYVGMPDIQRLYSPRFHEIRKRLQGMGIEMQGANGEPFSDDCPSPGIAAEVNLRRAAVPLQPAAVRNPYAVLGIPATASDEEVKHAHREHIKRNHPDKVAQMAEEFQRLAHQRTKEFNHAYERVMATRKGSSDK
jgi:hypothetical protein